MGEDGAIGSYGNTHQWISQVRWAPDSEYILSSVDYNGHVSLWDIRAKVALSVEDTHSGKGLCLDWVPSSSSGKSNVASGGSDCALICSEVQI